jgi:hypothetical protein
MFLQSLLVFWLWLALVHQLVTLYSGRKQELPDSTVRAMFPWWAIRRRFTVEKVTADGDSLYPCSVLIHAKSKKTSHHTLWVCMPMSLAPPNQPFITDPDPFSWVSNPDQSLIILSKENGTVCMYQRKPNHFEYRLVQEHKDVAMRQWVLSRSGGGKGVQEVAFGFHPEQPLLTLESNLQLSRLYCPIYRFGLHTQWGVSGSKVVAAYPSFHQWDGIVDLYQRNPFNPMLEWLTSLQAPTPASGFGFSIGIIQDRLMVGAPFHPHPMYGAGAVFMYSTEPPFGLRQIITCPEPFPHQQQGAVQFGGHLSLSPDGSYLVTVAHDRVYVFRYIKRRKHYHYMKTHRLNRTHDESAIRCVVTNHGHIFVYDDLRVHWLENRRLSRSKSVSLPPIPSEFLKDCNKQNQQHVV